MNPHVTLRAFACTREHVGRRPVNGHTATSTMCAAHDAQGAHQQPDYVHRFSIPHHHCAECSDIPPSQPRESCTRQGYRGPAQRSGLHSRALAQDVTFSHTQEEHGAIPHTCGYDVKHTTKCVEPRHPGNDCARELPPAPVRPYVKICCISLH